MAIVGIWQHNIGNYCGHHSTWERGMCPTVLHTGEMRSSIAGSGHKFSAAAQGPCRLRAVERSSKPKTPCSRMVCMHLEGDTIS